ncbi:hypothetical protein RJ639_041777 [Escallonia herrerae]|uniref:DOG1 domain-containing protein n=1 Tax=Escallonia herrerae TaxID=1293975 RepID=A0AA88WRT5_9ASTE|nr:hypothetical protein RJ639_041777 [Escallonia herrerae]
MGFHRFYDTWFEQLHHLVHQLTKAPRPPATQEDHHHLQALVRKVMTHYDDYYRVKSLAAKHDVLSVFSAPWCTSLERSLLWIAGWRPTTAFHLVYTEASILFESHIVDILRGLGTGDLGDLSPAQFSRVSELQCETVQEENAITDELSQWQACITISAVSDDAGDIVGTSRVNLDAKIEGLVMVVAKADELRLKTLRRVVDLLTPQQAVEFLAAAAQLQFGIRGWGSHHDRQRENP